MNQQKEAIRRRYALVRQELPSEDVAALSRLIGDRLLAALDWSAVQTVQTYLPLRRRNEIDTTVLLRTLWQHYPDIRVATWAKLTDPDHTFASVWLEPPDCKKGTPVSAGHMFDVILTPLVAFNDAGFRLGSGGGYYDRFLPTQPQAVTVGIAYESGQAAFLAETHDVPLDYIVTEKRVIAPTASRVS